MLIGSKSRKRPFGAMFGFGGSGLVATPEQEAETRRLEALYGIDPLGTGGQTASVDPVDSGTPQQQSKRPSFWQGGDKFRWQDGVAGALAALGDGLSRQSGGSGGGVEMLAGGRLSAIEQARKAQEAAQARAASVQRLTAAGYKLPQAEAMAAGDLKASDVKPDAPYRWKDNSGNLWEYDQNGQPKQVFIDKTQRYYIQGDQAISIPNPYDTPTGGQQRPDIGSIVPDPRRTGAQQPAPQGDRVLTPLQWQGAVQSLGPEQAEAWRRRNGYQIGGR